MREPSGILRPAATMQATALGRSKRNPMAPRTPSSLARSMSPRQRSGTNRLISASTFKSPVGPSPRRAMTQTIGVAASWERK